MLSRARLLIPLGSLLLTALPAFASLSWNGNGDGSTVFQEANWTDTNTGSAPPAGTIDGGSPVPPFPGGLIMAASSGTYGPYGPNFDLGGNTLHLFWWRNPPGLRGLRPAFQYGRGQ